MSYREFKEIIHEFIQEHLEEVVVVPEKDLLDFYVRERWRPSWFMKKDEKE